MPWIPQIPQKPARRARKPWLPSKARHKLCDDLLHDLAGSAADGEQSRVAEGTRDRGLDDVAHAAVELLAVVDDLLHQVAGEELGHRNLFDRGFLAGEQVA